MEVTESNAERFKNRSTFLEKQLDETRACLEEERTKNHSSVLSLEQHQVCAQLFSVVLLCWWKCLNCCGNVIMVLLLLHVQLIHSFLL